ncbi:MAG: DUF2489 domain-containing protein [Methylacidiphilales bacterium]|nr:DUF2489 domain-containing protein [Candidatus Methylacidiphilales bacterium]
MPLLTGSDKMKPPSWVKNEAQWYKQCRRLIARANELIEGRATVLETARKLIKYRFWFRAENDPDFQTFAAIDSETDHLPLGNVRQHWASEALKKKDIEIQQAETQFRPQAIEAAHNLIKKYGASLG